MSSDITDGYETDKRPKTEKLKGNEKKISITVIHRCAHCRLVCVLFLLIYWVTDVVLPYGRPAWWAYFATLAACIVFLLLCLCYFMFVWRINSLSLSAATYETKAICLVLCYRILFGLVHSESEEPFELNMRPSTRDHKDKSCIKLCISGRSIIFSERMVSVWNSLPKNVDFST